MFRVASQGLGDTGHAISPVLSPARRQFVSECCSSEDRVKKACRLHVQSVRKFDYVDETKVALAALDSTDVVSMKVRQLRQTLLRKSSLHPQFADAPAEQYARVRASHLETIVRCEHYQFYTRSV